MLEHSYFLLFHVQLLMSVILQSRDRSCDQHLVARDSVPQSVQQFRTSLDRYKHDLIGYNVGHCHT